MASLKPQKRPGAPGNLSTKKINNDMSTKTKYFLQKICYKKTASVDMTKYGFIKYASAMHPIFLLIKPLQAQLQKILGDKKTSLTINCRKPSLPSEQAILRRKTLKENTKSKSKFTIKQGQRRKVRIVSAKKVVKPPEVS